MPELPEVETVKNILKKSIINSKITNVVVNYERIIKDIDIEDFKTSLVNQTFVDVSRRGKFLIFILSDYILLSHLRMEGKFFIKPSDEPFNKHEHIIFELEDGRTLRYHDTRKFGVMYLFKTKSLEEVLIQKPLVDLGLEPFDDKLDLEYLKSYLSKSTRPIKSSLLNQGIISGLGNIYVNEVLFLSKIHPTRPSNELNDDEINSVIEFSRSVLEKAIELGGTSIHSFQSALEVSGRFQNELRIHMQKTCPTCKTDVVKIYVEQRGTYICEKCQVK